MTRDAINVLKPGTLYTDGTGRVFCRDHASAHARFTGRGPDGTPVRPLDDGIASLLAVPCQWCREARTVAF